MNTKKPFVEPTLQEELSLADGTLDVCAISNPC